MKVVQFHPTGEEGRPSLTVQRSHNFLAPIQSFVDGRLRFPSNLNREKQLDEDRCYTWLV